MARVLALYNQIDALYDIYNIPWRLISNRQ